ncbi:hypothetical protein [Sphingomonas bacterium]|uniref:hypothetical protein n=1 Tax=Sphingomonas bacterium TaxID=1895847 RepID=UPI00157655F9|nr:hypothetical protein [Sphingomonas bacterium]
MDLTTHDGATGAAEMGGFANFIAAGLSVLGIVVFGLLHLAPGISAASALVSATIEAAIFAVAGIRLRAGKGAIWGTVAALLMLVEMIGKLVTFNGVFSLVIDGILLVGMINGVRGALALRRGIADPDQLAEPFR